MTQKTLKHNPRLDDPDKIEVCGFKATELIKIASLIKSSDCWQISGQILFKEMQPVIRALTAEDEKRLEARKAFTGVSDIAKRITDRQTQRLRVLQQIFGWTLYEMGMESEFVSEMVKRLQDRTL
jgi:hypothetical protein